MYAEDDLLPLSGLQHLLFCERQCALIHIEQVWAENQFTAEGRIMHERVHEADRESRGNIRIEYAMPLRSLRLGLIAKADVVEFHRDADSAGAVWRPFPVEYKKGKPKARGEDEVQLCAQAMCLEEQLKVSVFEGALFYGERRRRHGVRFDVTLRNRTIGLAEQLHDLVKAGKTPPAEYGPKCRSCSLNDICNPTWMRFAKRKRFERMLFDEGC